LLYVTDHIAGDLPEIVALLRQRTGVSAWVGTAGFGIAGQDGSGAAAEYFDEPALAVMLADLPAGSFRLFGEAPLAPALGEWLAAARPTLGLVPGDPRDRDIPDLVAGLGAETGAYRVGGLRASRAGFPQLAGGVVEGGLSGVLFAADVAVATGLSQGCSPIGPPHAITEANQNIVARIDDRPALEVLIEDVRASGGGEEPVMAALPVPGSDTADYLVRNLIGADRERGCVA